jgi:hypothetical protein
VGGEHPHVAGDREFCPAANGVTVEQANNGHREVADGVQRGAGVQGHFLDRGAFAQAVEFFQVAPGGKAAFAGTGDGGGDQRLVAGMLSENVADFVQHRLRQCVALFRAIDEDAQNAVLAGDLQILRVHRAGSHSGTDRIVGNLPGAGKRYSAGAPAALGGEAVRALSHGA